MSLCAFLPLCVNVSVSSVKCACQKQTLESYVLCVLQDCASFDRGGRVGKHAVMSEHSESLETAFFSRRSESAGGMEEVGARHRNDGQQCFPSEHWCSWFYHHTVADGSSRTQSQKQNLHSARRRSRGGKQQGRRRFNVSETLKHDHFYTKCRAEAEFF